MQTPVWWTKASIEDKELAIRVLNRQASSLGAVSLDPIPNWDQRRRGVLFGDDLRRFRQGMRQADEPLQQVHEQWEAIEKWQKGASLPTDIRQCRREGCKTFLLVRKSRPRRVFCSPKCARAHHAKLCMREKIRESRERKLKRVRSAIRLFRDLPDWKERVARKARVRKNFITYGVRRGELRTPAERRE